MTGLERIRSVMNGREVDRLPFFPILHSALPELFRKEAKGNEVTDGAPGSLPALGDYFTDQAVMADVIIKGYRRFGLDGVQLSQGVTGEAEALGAAVEKPRDGAPLLKEHLLADAAQLEEITRRAEHLHASPVFSFFSDAVSRVVKEIGNEAFVLATIRGPLLICSQLRGVTQILMDMLDDPGFVKELLGFATEIAITFGKLLVESGAHGVMLGEATCSPSFISPDFYIDLIQPFHRRLVGELKQAGWKTVGLHICGATTPILDTIIETGVTLIDLDHQVDAAEGLARSGGEAVFRGNLDPSSVFRYGTVEHIRSETGKLYTAVKGSPWIMGSGCDVPPGTEAAQIEACAEQVMRGGGR